MANLDAQISSLAGTDTDSESAQWMSDGAREIINILPPKLKEKCMTETTLTNSSQTMNLDAVGEILHVTRLSADSGGFRIPCREVLSAYGELTGDSTSIYYASITDPSYWISSSSDATILTVNPTPTDNQTAIVYHVGYPIFVTSGSGTLDITAQSTIPNFPDESEYLVVLYAAIKVLQNKMNEKDTNSAIDTTALGAIAIELGETQAICDKVDADLVLSKAEIVLAKAEAAELATQTDNSSTFNTALAAIATELNKVDNIILEASTEFDKVDNVIVEGSVELDKSTALLDLGEADSEGAVNIAAAKIITELDETQSVCDKIDADLVLAKAEIVLAKAEAAELVTQTDNSGDIATALTAINTALDKFRADGSDPALFGDDSTYDTSNSQMTRVKNALDVARTIVADGVNSPTGNAEGDAASYLYTEEDTELVQGALSIAGTEIQRAQAHIAEWNATVQALLGEADGFGKEVQARVAFSGAKGKAIQGYISTAQSYVATAQGFSSEVQSKINIANGYIAEITIILQQASTKRQESQSRLTAGGAYIQEAQAIVSQGNAYISEAQAYISQAQGYAAEVNARAGFSSAKSQAVQGHINTAQSYVATAQGFGGELQSKINIAQGYIGEAKIRMERDSQKYGWYQAQQVKLQQDYDKGIQMLVLQGIPQPVQKERTK